MPKTAAKKAPRTGAKKSQSKKSIARKIRDGELTVTGRFPSEPELQNIPFQKRPKWDAFADLPKRADGTEEGINTSQINEYIRCPWRWQLRNRRMIDRRQVAPPMDLGSAVHAGIAGGIRYYAEADSRLTDKLAGKLHQAIVVGIRKWKDEWITEHSSIDDLPHETDQQLTEIQYKALEICEFNWPQLDIGRFEVIWLQNRPLVEQKIVIPFLDGIPYYGTPDVVWKDRDKGGNWVADYKTRKAMQNVEHEEVDLQLPAYQYMLGRLGIDTVGSMKIQLRAELPREPELTKKGTMSVQRIATTWEMYKAALLKHNLDPDDYEVEMKSKLDVEFFRLDRLYRNQFTIASFWSNIIRPIGIELARATEFIRHMHFMNCSGCWARQLCLGELRGEDTGFLLETDYFDATAPKPKMILRPEDITLVTEEE